MRVATHESQGGMRFKDNDLKIKIQAHSEAVRTLTDVNIKKLYQPWRSFAAIINKCLTRKSSGYNSLRLSQAQILWGLYHKRNVDYAYQMWEDFVYQVKHKNFKKSNEMYYPRFTKVIIHHFMSKDPSIPRRNKFSALLPIELTNEEIKNSNAYKEYYAIATGAAPPKPKASVQRTRSSSDTSITPPTTAVDEGTGSIPGVPNEPTDESEEELFLISIDDEGNDNEGKDGDGDDDDNGDDGEERDGDGADDDDDEDDDGNGDEDFGLNVGGEEGHVKEEEEDELYRDVNINQRRGIQATLEVKDSHVTLTPVNPDGQQQSSSVSSQFVTSMLNLTLDVGMESIFETTSQMDVQTPTSMASLPMIALTMTPSTIATITTISQAPILPTTVLSTIIQNLPNFGSLFGFDNRLRTLEANFFEFMQTNQFARASDRLRDEAQRENDEFLKTVDENMQKIIKEQVKEQVKALVEAYESDKIILDTYGETITLKRCRDDDADKDEEPSAGPDRGSKRRKEGEEPMQTTFQMEEPSHLEFDTCQQYTHNLLKPLPLISNNRGHRVIPFEHFINNDLEYLRRGASSRKYTTSITKTKAADYGHIKWIKDLVPGTMWIEEPIGDDKHALWGVSHWGRKRQQFYGFAVNRESARDVYSKRRIIVVTELKIVECHNYKHLEWITVRRDDDKLYKFKEGDFKRLRIQDIEDMLLLLVQGKLTNVTVEERFAFNVSLRMFTRSIVIQRRVEDLQLGVKSYQKKLNLTKPNSYRSDLKRKEAYTAYSNP
nr:hypothetical protein [Tanacetum cinerariifolium]